VFLQIYTRNTLPFTVTNVYNAPIGSTDAGEAVTALTATPQILWRSGLIAGDFNLHHPSWDPAHPTPSRQAEGFLDWLGTYGFAYTGSIGTPTHSQDNTLDLAFSTGPLLAYTTLAHQFDTTSDHYSLRTTVCWDSRISEPVRRLRLDTLDLAIFKNTLQSSLALHPALKDALNAADLDSEALQLT
jgi:hypothetical protein